MWGGDGIDTVNSSVSFHLWSSEVENLTLTGLFNNDAYGESNNNTIRGNVGDNYLDGGGGIDTLIGGAGDDTYEVDAVLTSNYANHLNTDDTVVELAGEGFDTMRVSGYSFVLPDNVERMVLVYQAAGSWDPGTVPVGADTRPRLTGNALNNVIDGSDEHAFPNLVLDGGAGADEMIGGQDGHTFVIDNPGDVIRFYALGDPIGNVETYISYTAPSFIRNLTLLGSGAISATGNALNNTLDGSKNTAGNVLAGGVGNDTYIVDSGDTVIELAGDGTDTVQTASSFALSGNVENLTLSGTSAINGTGDSSNNQLTGNSGANVLNGGTGADTMIGGAGNDTYVVDEAGDIVTEGNNAGTDLVQSSISYTLGSNLERLTLIGSAAINATGNTLGNIITGNSGNNTLNGGTAGIDTLLGGAGNDTYVVDRSGLTVTEAVGEGTDLVQSTLTYTLGTAVENLTLQGSSAINGTGNADANVIIGNSGNNTLNGMDGADTLIGGAGNDTYDIGAGDVVTENPGEGTDLVRSTVNHTLAADFENLTLLGSNAINATGNGSVNILIGNGGANVIDGGAGADDMTGGSGNDTFVVDNTGDIVRESSNGGTDTIQSSVTLATLAANVEHVTLIGSANINAVGSSGNNTLTGNSGNNVLNGNGGTDTFIGGLGDDTYVVDSTTDIVTEAASAGTDTIQTSVVLSSLAAQVENLVLSGTIVTGTGNTLNNVITGNTAANTLTGNDGNDTLYGLGGNDTLNGGNGDDILDGGAGTDGMTGGAGNDTYFVDIAADSVTEASGGGSDTIQTTVQLNAWAANVENMTMLGTGNLNTPGTTSGAANVLVGNSGVNSLNGGAGDDTLNGAGGNDALTGGTGADTYQYFAGGGTDTIDNVAADSLIDRLRFLDLASNQVTFSRGGTGKRISSRRWQAAAP